MEARQRQRGTKARNEKEHCFSVHFRMDSAWNWEPNQVHGRFRAKKQTIVGRWHVLSCCWWFRVENGAQAKHASGQAHRMKHVVPFLRQRNVTGKSETNRTEARKRNSLFSNFVRRNGTMRERMHTCAGRTNKVPEQTCIWDANSNMTFVRTRWQTTTQRTKRN